jgi:hypothetical protein
MLCKDCAESINGKPSNGGCIDCKGEVMEKCKDCEYSIAGGMGSYQCWHCPKDKQAKGEEKKDDSQLELF